MRYLSRDKISQDMRKSLQFECETYDQYGKQRTMWIDFIPVRIITYCGDGSLHTIHIDSKEKVTRSDFVGQAEINTLKVNPQLYYLCLSRYFNM